MSEGITVRFGGGSSEGFLVKSMCGCRVVFGPVPSFDFGMLTFGFSKKALMATDLADLMGASFVIGEPADLDELRKADLPVSEKRHRDYLSAHQKGLYGVAMWLRTGERGKSSNAMCKHLFGIPQDAGSDHPNDPGDLRRCIQLLDAAQAHDKVPMMAEVSPAWAQLIANWEKITEVFRAEMLAGTTAPKTYKLMQEAMGKAG